MQFFPKDMTEPTTGNSQYMKFVAGKNKFRVMTDAVVGYVVWEDKTPTRTKEPTGKKDEKEFWAFAVVDRADSTIKLLEVTQKTIMKGIYDLVMDEDWGDPSKYDITVNREGEGMETRYSVLPGVKSDITELETGMMSLQPMDLEALFTGDDPFVVK